MTDQLEVSETESAYPPAVAQEFQVGKPVDEVKIDIDYAIIKHFSEHL